MKIVCISDTHGSHLDVDVPEGDILIHCGDLTNDIGQANLRGFLDWFQAQPHKHKVFIAGNHDGAFEKWPDLACAMVKERAPDCIYLQDSGCEVEGLRMWGSPYTPTFMNWYFMRDRGEAIKRHWDMIPDYVDVLITHGPPAGVLDKSNPNGEHLGCEDLRDTLDRVRPLVHCFGHIHGGHGFGGLDWEEGELFTTCVNVSILNENYKATNAATIVNL